MLSNTNSKLKKFIEKVNNDPEKYIIGFLTTLLMFSAISLMLLKFWGYTEKDSFGRDVGKTLLQIIAVAVIGTTGSLLLALLNYRRMELQKLMDKEQINREKEQVEREKLKERERISNENKNQFLKDMLKEINEINAIVKKERRMFRARAINIAYSDSQMVTANINLEMYDSFMDSINSSQLKLEMISKEVKTNKTLFSNTDLISDFIKPMKKCLNRLVTEYEKKRCLVKQNSSIIPISDLCELRKMLEPTTTFEGTFGKDFFANNYLLSTAIRQEILNFK